MWLIFPENIGEKLSLDETSLSHGELYTVLTNKSARGRKGCIVAIVAGTKSEDVIRVIEKINLSKRNKVKEITLDMAGSMNLIAKKCFPKATLVTDRFHVQKLAVEALQEIRVKYRWEVIDAENDAIDEVRENKKTFEPEFFQMEIPESNCWQEAGICSIKANQNGHQIRQQGQSCFSQCIRI